MNRCSRWFLIFEDSSKNSVMNCSRPYASMQPLTIPSTAMLSPRVGTEGGKKAKREQYVLDTSNTPFTFLIQPPKSLEMSPLTLSIHSSCVNTNIEKKESSSGTVIILFTMHSWQTHIHSSHQLRPHTPALQENGCEVSMTSGPVKVAEAFNAFLTLWILCQMLRFSDYKSVNTKGEILITTVMWNILFPK